MGPCIIAERGVSRVGECGLVRDDAAAAFV